jgi:hypothetical protein
MTAVRDLKNNVDVDLSKYIEILADGSTTGTILDTADYDSGIMFCFAIPDYGDGTYSINMYESDHISMSTQTIIPDEKLIGSTSDLVFTSATSQGDAVKTLGIVGTKRYVRPIIASTGATTGATFFISINKVHEILPIQ